MEYRFFEHDTDFWDRENIKISVDELKRRFGIKTKDKNASMQSEDEEIKLEYATDERGLHQCKTPKFDIYDEELKAEQLAEFCASGVEKKED